MATATNSARAIASHRCRFFPFLFFSVFPFFRFAVFPFSFFLHISYFLFPSSCIFPISFFLFPAYFLFPFSFFLHISFFRFPFSFFLFPFPFSLSHFFFLFQFFLGVFTINTIGHHWTRTELISSCLVLSQRFRALSFVGLLVCWFAISLSAGSYCPLFGCSGATAGELGLPNATHQRGKEQAAEEEELSGSPLDWFISTLIGSSLGQPIDLA